MENRKEKLVRDLQTCCTTSFLMLILWFGCNKQSDDCMKGLKPFRDMLRQKQTDIFKTNRVAIEIIKSIEKGERPRITGIRQFDREGRCISEEVTIPHFTRMIHLDHYYDAQGKIQEKTYQGEKILFSYDSLNRASESYMISTLDSLIWKKTYKYDQDNQLIFIFTKWLNRNLVQVDSIAFSDGDKTMEILSWSSDVSTYSTKRFVFDEKCKETGMISFGHSGHQFESDAIEYYSDSIAGRFTTYGSSGIEITIELIVCDGDLRVMRSQLQYPDSGLSWYRRFYYAPNGLLSREEIRDNSGQVYEEVLHEYEFRR